MTLLLFVLKPTIFRPIRRMLPHQKTEGSKVDVLSVASVSYESMRTIALSIGSYALSVINSRRSNNLSTL